MNNPTCQHCGGTGWLLDGQGRGVRPCACRAFAEQQARIRRVNIPPRFSHCTLINFKPLCPALRRALKLCREYADDYEDAANHNIRGLLLVGPCGVGKTHLATAILGELLRKGADCIFRDFPSLLKQLQDSYSPRGRESERQILEPIFAAEVLVLDELGASKPTEWAQEMMTHIITRRYNDAKPTIFTSNYLDVPDTYPETLTERVGARLRSRLHEMCVMVVIEADDYRQRRKS